MSDARRRFKTFTLRERPELEDEFERLAEVPRVRQLRPRRRRRHSIPLAWDGTPADLLDSMAAILERAARGRAEQRRPTALCALAALVGARQRGQGLSRVVLETMRGLAGQWRLGAFVAPVRPAQKSEYPLTPMERYVRWRNAEDLPLDRWMRVHARPGAELVRVIPRAMVIVGTVAEREAWTEIRFPDSGPYVVPGALQPVVIDRERDEGRYEDPNVWMRHSAGR